MENKELEEETREEAEEEIKQDESAQAETADDTPQTGGEEKDSAGEEPSDTADSDGTPEHDEECSEDQDHGEKKKKGHFNKKKDPKDAEIEDLTDKLKRQMAEFDNYRKRTEKEKASMYEYGARDVIEKILPIVDNFERGLSTIPDDQKEDAFVDGMEKIYRQLTKMLDDLGVKPIEAVGKEFDPAYHNAVMHVEDENLGENVVAQELQKGYTYKDTVIRHSMVQVAN